ncbi:MAG: prephenate dehydratase domain-containing protein [Gemmatimonadota bacterium]
MNRVAIQGIEGSYSHEAALAWFGSDAEILPCRSFPGVFEAMELGHAGRAVVPVENTVVGPIAGIAALLRRKRTPQVGEIRLRVDHCLVVAGAAVGRPRLDESLIRQVASHPIALAQCRRFLRARPDWQTVETADTAGAARALAAGRLYADAVIASRPAAERYGCRVVRASIQDAPVNVTSFVILEAAVPVSSVPRATDGGPARTAPDPCWRADRRR